MELKLHIWVVHLYLPVEQHLVEEQVFLVRFEFRSHSVTQQFEHDGFGVLFDAANKRVLVRLYCLRVRPYGQLLQYNKD